MEKIGVSDPTVVEIAKVSGLDPKVVAQAVNGERYRKEYNKRPKVVAARKEYSRKRQEMVKEALRVVREMRKKGEGGDK